VHTHDSETRAEIEERPGKRRIDERQYGEFFVVEDGLSSEQHRIASDLQRLYTSLCGGVPGQVWPQALLETAGNFNRPVFPHRERGRK